MLKKSLLSLFLITLLCSTQIQANESIDDDLSGFSTDEDISSDDISGFEEESELDGFDEESDYTNEEEVQELQEEPSKLSLSGNVAFKSSYGYQRHTVSGIDYSGFNQAQTALYLQADYKLSKKWKLRASGDAFYDLIYDIHSDKNYAKNVLDAYQTQLRIDDIYAQGSITRDIDLKIGRQIVVWGKSDSIRITDVINPLDNRLPGLTDIEDLRLSTTMAKLDYYHEDWNFSTMLIAESRIMLEATPNGEFFPALDIFSSAPNPFIELVQPEHSLDNLQYALGANGVFSGWDLSFYGANVLDQKWHFDKIPSPSTPLSSVKRVVSKINMLGSAINIASGSWLLKSEVAFINGVRYNSTADEKDRADLLVGFDYMGVKDTVLSLEIANRHIFEYETQMGGVPDFVDEDEIQTALRATKSFLNDTLNATALVSMFGSSWQKGGFARVWAEYDLMDGVVANAGIVDYIGGDREIMQANSNNDRLFMDITFSF
ncbi:DUF1302 domain-containing protein [Sulfurimonas aquatica]|uniref:DUF1302 domain-containing protein n=1 Tax=Sulfurimonas aquatica TaxID=2672570 RepID=A0A975AZK1_9BACT|nr:DUF1302 family protein [Sulfurimonas aquatica]QSZ41388.1 DUF1302 domain-containing protein [Sulfurimonas aquatica]